MGYFSHILSGMEMLKQICLELLVFEIMLQNILEKITDLFECCWCTWTPNNNPFSIIFFVVVSNTGLHQCRVYVGEKTYGHFPGQEAESSCVLGGWRWQGHGQADESGSGSNKCWTKRPGHDMSRSVCNWSLAISFCFIVDEKTFLSILNHLGKNANHQTTDQNSYFNKNNSKDFCFCKFSVRNFAKNYR